MTSGLVPFEEPFPRIRLGGLIVKDGAKMSKSRGNVVGPDGYVEAHGSDVLRCALLFTCPWEDGRRLPRRHPRRHRAVLHPGMEDRRRAGCQDDGPDPRVERTIVAVTDAIEKLSFNVGLARLMELVPAATTNRAKRVLVQLLAPFAPHLAEELWARPGRAFQRPHQRMAHIRRIGDALRAAEDCRSSRRTGTSPNRGRCRRRRDRGNRRCRGRARRRRIRAHRIRRRSFDQLRQPRVNSHHMPPE